MTKCFWKQRPGASREKWPFGLLRCLGLSRGGRRGLTGCLPATPGMARRAGNAASGALPPRLRGGRAERLGKRTARAGSAAPPGWHRGCDVQRTFEFVRDSSSRPARKSRRDPGACRHAGRHHTRIKRACATSPNPGGIPSSGSRLRKAVGRRAAAGTDSGAQASRRVHPGSGVRHAGGASR